MKNLFNIAVITVLAGVLLTGCNSKESDYKVELLNYIESSNNNNIDLNTAVSKVLIDHQSLILNGEVLTEGHVILDKEETNDYIKVYLIASGGNFGFEGDNFTIISGYSLVPMVIEFSKDENNNLKLIKKEEPMDGSYYIESLKKIFPHDLHKTVIHETERYREEIEKQQELQAKDYLKSINKEAKVIVN